jgi:hypothetical protein
VAQAYEFEIESSTGSCWRGRYFGEDVAAALELAQQDNPGCSVAPPAAINFPDNETVRQQVESMTGYKLPVQAEQEELD